MEKMRVAVIGCGVISDIYLENLTSAFSIFEVKSCCDLNSDAAQSMADRYGIQVMTFEEILADRTIELVINLTTPEAHYPLIKQLLENGKHVYTEKPLATTLEHAEDLVATANREGLHLASAPDTFLGAALQTARHALDSGMIGIVTSCIATLNRDGGLMAEKYPYTAKVGGGIGTDVGIYYVTALISLLGPISEVCGITDTVTPQRTHCFTSRPSFGEPFRIESENLVAGSFRFKNGVVGSLHFNANCIQNETPFIILYGSEGILFLPDPNRFGGEVRVQMKGHHDYIVLPYTHGYSENSRGIGAAEMAWAIKNARTPRAGKEIACHGLELLLGLMESSRTKTFYQMRTDCERPCPLPRGFLGAGYFNAEAESSLAL